VICDRFTDSTLIYQVFGKKINKKVNLINQKFILKRFKPNLTIILKSDLKKIIKRIKVRKNNNKFDKLKLSFFKKAQNSYVSLSKKNRRDYLIFDSSLDNNQLEKEILLNVVKRIGN
jgi:dTMP kinase